MQQSDVTSLVHVTTLATFDSLRVNVLSIDHRTGKVAFVANLLGRDLRTSSSAHPPHSEAQPDPRQRRQHRRLVRRGQPHRLTDIHSSSEELDVSLYGIPRGGSAVVARTRTVEDLDLVRSDGPHGALRTDTVTLRLSRPTGPCGQPLYPGMPDLGSEDR